MDSRKTKIQDDGVRKSSMQHPLNALLAIACHIDREPT
jgi:hypothetical protein